MDRTQLDTKIAEILAEFRSGPQVVPATPVDNTSLARMIDHTLLRPDATIEEIEKLCGEARSHGFATVCVNPTHVPRCLGLLRNSIVRVCAPIGFPLGATSTAAKVAETIHAIQEGAAEVDMVMNIGLLKSGDLDSVLLDIAAVREAAKERGALTKVILETGLLSDEEKVMACLLAADAAVDFVKTSTGFSKGGATASDIALMRKVVGPAMGVKASGGIRTREDALLMIANGATRIGASAGVAILKGSSPSTGAGY
jgi:deoxyribose-phosphate aldolase